MATALPILNVQEPGTDLARQTVFIKVHLGLLGNTRKVSSSQVEVDADKALIRVSKTLLDSPELQAIRTLDGDIRHFLYDMCLPFEVGIHLCRWACWRRWKRSCTSSRISEGAGGVVSRRLSAPVPRGRGRLRTLYNPTDYPPVDEVRSRFTFSWQYVSYGVPEQLREISARFFERSGKRPCRPCRKLAPKSSR